jgi:surface protein
MEIESSKVGAFDPIAHSGADFVIKIKSGLTTIIEPFTLTVTDSATGATKVIYARVMGIPPVITMKTGPEINTILKTNFGAETTECTFSASTTPPAAGTTTYELSATGSDGECIAWLDGTNIKYYANGYTDVSPVTKITLNADSSEMFKNCKKLTSIDMSGFDTSNVTNMTSMFYYCQALTSLDVSSFNTCNVTNMYSMFHTCKAMTSITGLSSWDTSKVTNMSAMFCTCEKVSSLDLSSFDTSEVTNMNSMFNDCNAVTSLDLSNFNTSNVTTMYYMFYNNDALTTIYVSSSGLDVSGIPNDEPIFVYCYGLVGGAGTAFVTGRDSKTYARIDGGDTAPGYFTLKP